MSERPVKKIHLRYQSPPLATQKEHVLANKKKGKKLLFNEDRTEQPFDEVSQKKVLVAIRGEDLPDKDMTDTSGHYNMST